MPSSEEILNGLGEIAWNRTDLAIFWHLHFAILVVALLAGYRISRRMLGILLAIPLLSVGMLAWASANPFNGTLFVLGAAALIVIAARLGRESSELASLPLRIVGGLLFAFGWAYPHFLNPDSMLTYLYASPLGLIPCPTLSAVAGLTLMFGGLGSVCWTAVVGVLGLFYGFYGAAILGVSIDWVLFFGALCVLALSARKMGMAQG